MIADPPESAGDDMQQQGYGFLVFVIIFNPLPFF
jgi:hypothetical protein